MASGLLAFFVALIASLVLVVPVRALGVASRYGRPSRTPQSSPHSHSIAGGLGNVRRRHDCGVFAFDGPARAQIEGILAGASLVAAIGILDDRGLLHHQIKLFIGMPLRR